METRDEKAAPAVQSRTSRSVKDGMFRTLFKEDRKALLQLYNALNGTDYTDASALEIVTIENAVYIVMKNDLAFVLTDTLNLYEHQSTVSANLPVRFLLYLAEEYQMLIEGMEQSIYGRKQIRLPSPRCVVFYNGEEERPDRWELRLSDAFAAREADPDGQSAPDAELRVQVYNINAGHNGELMEKCPVLAAYAEFTAVCRRYLAQGLERQKACAEAVEYCIRHDILRDFLRKNRAEVVGMLLTDFDAEKYERTIRAEGVEEGIEQGIEKGIEQGIEEGYLAAARRMLQAGKLSYEEIALYSGLPIEEVRKLAMT